MKAIILYPTNEAWLIALDNLAGRGVITHEQYMKCHEQYMKCYRRVREAKT